MPEVNTTPSPAASNPVTPGAPVTVKPFSPETPLPQAMTPLPPPPPPNNPPPTSSASVQKSPFRFLIPILGVIIILVLLFLVFQKVIQPRLSGPTPKSSAAPKITTITYWGLWEPNNIMKATFDKFQADNPDIKVNYQQQSVKDYRERLQNALKNGTGPDIYRYHMTWAPLLSGDLTSIPSTIMSSQEFESQQYPVAQQWLKSSKGYLGIPLMYEGLGLFYNQAIFEAAGKTPPKTWEELRKLALEFTQRNKQGEIQQAGVALGTTSNVDNWSDILGILLVQNAANPMKPNNQLGQDALTFYTLFANTDRVWSDALPNSTVAFASNKVAMIIAPSWRALEVKDMNPNLRFAIAPLPQLPDTQVSWASFWVEGVSSHSDAAKQAAAWKLVSYLNQKDTLRDWYAAASKERLFGEIFARTDMADQLKTDSYVGAFVEQAPFAQSWYLCSRTFDNGPNDKIIKYYEDAINAINQSQPASGVLDTTEQGIAQIVSQYRLPTSSTKR